MTEYVSSPQFVKITSKLRQTGYLSDASIILDDNTRYDVHKVILAANSNYFKALFTFNNNEDTEYRLKCVTKEGFDPILSWIYKHELKLSRDSVEKILSTAHYLDCHEVIGRCISYVQDELSVENALSYEGFARAYNVVELIDHCAKYVRYNFASISQVPQGEFFDLSLDDLCDLLEAEDLNANEQTVWMAAMQWVELEASRVRHLSHILKRIRLGQFTEDFFRQVVKKDLMPFQPLEDEVEALIAAAEDYYETLRNVAEVESPLETPNFALPRLPQYVVLAFGGWTSGSACNLVESYDVRADRWTSLPYRDPLGERGYIGAAAIGSKIYLVGGTNGERHFNATSYFDVETRTFSVLGPMHSCRCYISLTAMDGHLYAIGGFDGSRRLKTIERYDPEKNQWSLMAPMKNQRSDAGCTSLGGKIYVVGGFDGVTQLDTVEVYTPKTNKWSTISKMSTPRSGVSCVALKGELYALGGFNGNQRLRSCEKYDPRTKKWTSISEMMTTRSNFSAVVVEETIMVIGGFNGYTTSELVECYDPTQNCWCSSSDLRVHRSALSVCVVPGILLPDGILQHYAYPNRNNLPEEKRLYERSLGLPAYHEDRYEEMPMETEAEETEDHENLSDPEEGDHADHAVFDTTSDEDEEEEDDGVLL